MNKKSQTKKQNKILQVTNTRWVTIRNKLYLESHLKDYDGKKYILTVESKDKPPKKGATNIVGTMEFERIKIEMGKQFDAIYDILVKALSKKHSDEEN